jgi:hypothetical protein
MQTLFYKKPQINRNLLIIKEIIFKVFLGLGKLR